MSENEYLEEEEVVTDDQSNDENQEGEETYETPEEESEDEPQKESFVQKLRRENKELKKQLKSSPKESQKLDQNLEMRLFFIENPELKEDKEGILETLWQHPTLTPLQAHALYKAEKPKESETIKESFKGGGYKPKPKTMADLSMDEAEKTLNPQDWIKYLKIKGVK